jgi:7-cyano-7-deazaguanine synthase
MKTRYVVVLSGGMDSTTLLSYVLANYAEDDKSIVDAISFNYGQRHLLELSRAIHTAKILGIQHRVIPLTFLSDLAPKSSLTSSLSVPEGHYADETMKQTVVPGRNTLFLAAALSFTEGQLADDEEAIIFYGAHAGDHQIYPDCRPSYVVSMDEAIKQASNDRVSLEAPFIYDDKAEIIRTGMLLGVDYSNTLTCYNGSRPACGRCGSCVERLLAFDEVGIEDPLTYIDRETYKQYGAK